MYTKVQSTAPIDALLEVMINKGICTQDEYESTYNAIISRYKSESDNRLNELCNPYKWENEEWLKIHMDLDRYSTDKHCFSTNIDFAYRKGWEWTQFIFGLTKLGFINQDSRALCVGAGHEPTLYYLADQIREVVATDLYGNEMWGDREAPNVVFESPEQFCPIPYNKDHLIFKHMDGTNLDIESDSFDIVWSLSSIEHFGGHENANKAIQEMSRITRPGGIVVVATEFIINDPVQSHPEYFTKQEYEDFIIHADPRLNLIEPMNYQLPDIKFLADPIMLPRDMDRVRHHIILNDGTFQWTSAITFFRKK